MKFIDTHSHLFLKEFADDLSEVIERAENTGVSKIFMPNIDCSSISAMLDVASKYEEYCYPMIGLHPTSVNESYKDELSEMKKLLNAPNKFVAIGEVGLDLYWDKTFQKEQAEAFELQIQWSIQYGLPLVIHCRDAFDEMYNLMLPYINEQISGIFHSFTGSVEEAVRLMEFKGFKLGINGVVTFKKSTLPVTLKKVPIEKIVMETDSPYLTPVPNRGKRNESSNVKDVLIKLSEIYDMPMELLAEITSANALNVFRTG